MGHSAMRAALIYQHATSERDREIDEGMDKRIAKQHVTKTATTKPAKSRRPKNGDDPDDGTSEDLPLVG